MAVQALLASDYGTELAQAMGQELADSYRSAAVPTDRQIALSEEDNEQVADYWAALYGDYTYFYQGSRGLSPAWRMRPTGWTPPPTWPSTAGWLRPRIRPQGPPCWR